MRRRGGLFTGLAFSLVSVLPSWAVEVSASRYREDVKYLSSGALKGRGTGTPELEKAAAYIAREFKKAGVKPVPGSSYLQPFQVSVKSRLGSKSRLQWTSAGAAHVLKPGDDFIPLPFSGSGAVTGSVVFAGYGISAREYGYDDYRDLDVQGKIVVMLRHEPQEYEASGIFEGRVYTEHSQLFSKAVNARQHGAAAVVLVNDTNNHSSDPLDKFVSAVGPADPGLPFVQVRSEIVRQWFEAAGADLDGVQKEIDEKLQPRSLAFPGLQVEIEADVQHKSRAVHNVVGYLPGQTSEYIVVGAHYDHLGLGEQYSMDPDKVGSPHPGADDNASGTAGLLALARWFGSQSALKRGVLFIAFAGEELGLLGSGHYVTHPILPLDRAALMINMDMIGRVRDDKVIVGSAESGDGLRDLLKQIGRQYPFSLDLGHDAVYGSSDHTAFKTKLIPVLFFFTGLHGDYHRPTDTWEKIDAKRTSKLLEMIGDVITAVARQTGRPQFVFAPGANQPTRSSERSNVSAGAASGSGH